MNLQVFFPREFRVQRSYSAEVLRGDLEKLLELLDGISDCASTPTPQVVDSDNLKVLVAIANGVWRMRRAMVPGEGVSLLAALPREESRKPFRWLLSIWEALEERGIKIVDHTGSKYRSGMTLKVHFEPSNEVETELITDTFKPTIYLVDDLVQVGEVLVATPKAGEK